jgi:hypothetical protein
MFTGEFGGRWWLPGQQEVVTGTLHSAWDEWPLVTGTGLLEPATAENIFPHFGGPFVRHPLVLGRTSDNKLVSLEGVHVSLRQVHFAAPEDASIELQAQRAYLGMHFGPEPPTFRGADVQVEFLIDFLGRDAIEEEWIFRDDRQVGVKLSASRDEETVIPFPGGTLTVGVDVNLSGDRWRERRIVRVARALFRLDEPVSPDVWLASYITPLASLMCLVTGEPSVMESVAFKGPSAAEPDLRVELLWRGESPQPPRDHVLLPHEILFTAANPPIPLDQILAAWLRAWKELRPVLELYLGTRRRQRLYEEHRLLNLTQALEAFHRIRMGGHPTDPRTHDERVKRVLATLSATDRKWAGLPLKKAANEFTLADRLNLLVSAHSWMLGDVVSANPRQFGDEVALTRNYHTHWDEVRGAGATTGVELWPLNERLTVLVEACLLTELGFPESAVEESIRGASSSYRALKLNGY